MKEEVEGEAMGLRIECPLCHTKFSLEDGKVVEFCPKDGPVAWAVGLLKEKSPAVQAKVYFPNSQFHFGEFKFDFFTSLWSSLDALRAISS